MWASSEASGMLRAMRRNSAMAMIASSNRTSRPLLRVLPGGDAAIDLRDGARSARLSQPRNSARSCSKSQRKRILPTILAQAPGWSRKNTCLTETYVPVNSVARIVARRWLNLYFTYDRAGRPWGALVLGRGLNLRRRITAVDNRCCCGLAIVFRSIAARLRKNGLATEVVFPGRV